MFQFLLVTSVILATGQLQQIPEKNYKDISEREFESVHKLLSDAALDRMTSDPPPGLTSRLTLPCTSRLSEVSGRRQLEGLDFTQKPSPDISYKQLELVPETQPYEKVVNPLLLTVKPKKKSCRAQLIKNENNANDFLKDITNSNNKITFVNAKKHSYINSVDDVDFRASPPATSKFGYMETAKQVDAPPVKLCGTTMENTLDLDNDPRRAMTNPSVKFCGSSTMENSLKLNTRRSMSDGSPLNVPSAVENQNIYQQNMNLRNDIIRNQLISSIYNKGQGSSLGNYVGDDVYKDYPENILSQNIQNSNNQKLEKPATKNIKLGKSNDALSVNEQNLKTGNNSRVKDKATSYKILRSEKSETEIISDTDENNSRLGGRVDQKMNYLEDQLIEPTKGFGITDMSQMGISLLDHPRVCFACSSTSDVTCWRPNRQTTVKYCNKRHDACITKTYNSPEQGFIVIRDCGNTCNVKMPFLDNKYSSCSLCKTDLCNYLYVGSSATMAFSMNSFWMMMIVAGVYNILL